MQFRLNKPFPDGIFKKNVPTYQENETPDLLKRIEFLENQNRGLKAHITYLKRCKK